MGIKQKGIDLAVDLSYRRRARQMENLSGVSISRTRLNSWVKGTKIELDLSLEDWPKLIYADGTGYHRQDGTKGKVKPVLVKGFSWKVDGANCIQYDTVCGRELGGDSQAHKVASGRRKDEGLCSPSDGEEAIERNLLVEGMEHQRCQWHGWKDLGYVLWADGMSKEEREVIVSQLRKLTIPLLFEETIAEEDKEGIRAKLKGVKASPEEMVLRLRCRAISRHLGISSELETGSSLMWNWSWRRVLKWARWWTRSSAPYER
jgi:hypothetical protein